MIRVIARLVRALPGALAVLAVLAGLPAALIAVAGWPLPDRLPRGDQLLDWAASADPLSLRMLGALLVCGLWVWWLVLMVLVARAVAGAVRQLRAPHLHVPAPRQGMVAGIVGALVLGASRAAAAHTGGDILPAAPGPTAVAGANPAPSPARPASNTTAGHPVIEHIVQPGDTLWDIAKAETGDPENYLPISAANQGRIEPDGRTFGNPDLIFPGWEIVIPATTQAAPTPPPPRPDAPSRPAPPAPPDQPAPTGPPWVASPDHGPGQGAVPAPPSPSAPGSVSPPPTSTPGAGRPPTQPTTPPGAIPPGMEPPRAPKPPGSVAPSPATPDHTAHQPRPQGHNRQGHGSRHNPAVMELGDGWGWVTAGLAAGLAAAASLARHRYHARHRRNRAQTTLGQAHLRQRLQQLLAPALAAARSVGMRWNGPRGAHTGVAVPFAATPTGDQIGIEQVAAAGGLALHGDGAHGAARAVLVAALSAGGPEHYAGQAEVIVPRDVLDTLLGADCGPLAAAGGRLVITADLAQACSHAEDQLVYRHSLTDTDPLEPADRPAGEPMIPVILIAHPHPSQKGRLRAILAQGAHLGLYGLLLDAPDWPGACHVSRNGRLTPHPDNPPTNSPATAPDQPPGLPLEEARASVLSADATRHALALLADTHDTDPAVETGPVPPLRPSVTRPPPPTPEAGTDSARHATGSRPAPPPVPEGRPAAAVTSTKPRPLTPRPPAVDRSADPTRSEVPATRPSTRQEASPPGHRPAAISTAHTGASPTTAAPPTRPPADARHTNPPNPVPAAAAIPGESDGHQPDQQQSEPQHPIEQAPDPAPHDDDRTPDHRRPDRATSLVRLDVLGEQVVLHAGGTAITEGLRRRADALLAYLAVHRNGATTAQILADLWPDHPEDSATGSLYSLVSNIRRRIRTAAGPGTTSITCTKHRYRLAPTVTVDLWTVEDLLAELPPQPGACHQPVLWRIADIYHSGLAPTTDGGTWAEPVRVDLHHRVCRAIRALSDSYLPNEPATAAGVLERATALDGLNEDTYRRIMRLYAGAGEHDELHRVLQIMAARFRQAGIDPDPNTLDLAKRLRTHSGPGTAAGKAAGAAHGC